MLDDIKALLNCGDEEVEKQAQIIIDVTEHREAGHITESEYKEILEDCVRMNNISEMSDDMVLKANLAKAASLILKLL